MKQIFRLLTAAVIVLASASACIDKGLNDRLDHIENRVGTIEAAIDKINASISALETAKDGIQGRLTALEQDISQAAALDSARALVAAMNIDGLKKYAEDLSNGVKDWADAKFVTLDTLNGIRTTLVQIESTIAELPGTDYLLPLITEAKAAIDAAIESLGLKATEMIQSVTIVPAYTDGGIAVSDGVLEMTVIVQPARALTGITSANLKDSLTLFATPTTILVTRAKTPATKVATLEISDAEITDPDKGVIQLHAEVELPEDLITVYPADKGISVALNVRNGISDCTTKFANLYPEEQQLKTVEDVIALLQSVYEDMYCIYAPGYMMHGAPIDALTDMYHCYNADGGPVLSYYNCNLSAESQNADGRFPSMTETDGTLPLFYETVRKCWRIIEQTEGVTGIDEAGKSNLRGQTYTLLACHYFNAFRNFGGLCLVNKASRYGEKVSAPRATAFETVKFIDELIRKGIDEPGFVWNAYDHSQAITRASARALRAKLWHFAASPLFNDDMPYMHYDPESVTEQTNVEHIWFGKKDPTLWGQCVNYCNEFFQDNQGNGEYYKLVQPETQDEAGYRIAYRRAYRYPNDVMHHEKLFDAPAGMLSSLALDAYRQGCASPTAELTECFGMADGTNYPYAGIYGEGNNPDGTDIFTNRDPRLYETVAVPRAAFPAQAVGDYNGRSYIDSWVGGGAGADDADSGLKKFKWLSDYSSAKMNDAPVSISFVRLAEMYLMRAEARAEVGDQHGALEDINTVRSRVGLGKIEDMNLSLNLKSNKENLIREILRERVCELGVESGERFYDLIRRKCREDFCKPLHELKVYRLDDEGKRMTEGDLSWNPATPWPKFEYERPEITVNARNWWTEGWTTDKWYLEPLSPNGLSDDRYTQNPGW